MESLKQEWNSLLWTGLSFITAGKNLQGQPIDRKGQVLTARMVLRSAYVNVDFHEEDSKIRQIHYNGIEEGATGLNRFFNEEDDEEPLGTAGDDVNRAAGEFPGGTGAKKRTAEKAPGSDAACKKDALEETDEKKTAQENDDERRQGDEETDNKGTPKTEDNDNEVTPGTEEKDDKGTAGTEENDKEGIPGCKEKDDKKTAGSEENDKEGSPGCEEKDNVESPGSSNDFKQSSNEATPGISNGTKEVEVKWEFDFNDLATDSNGGTAICESDFNTYAKDSNCTTDYYESSLALTDSATSTASESFSFAGVEFKGPDQVAHQDVNPLPSEAASRKFNPLEYLVKEALIQKMEDEKEEEEANKKALFNWVKQSCKRQHEDYIEGFGEEERRPVKRVRRNLQTDFDEVATPKLDFNPDQPLKPARFIPINFKL